MALSCRRGPNAHYPGGHLARTPLEGSIRSFRSPRSPPLDTAAMARHACVANTPSWKLHAGDPFYFHQFTRPEPRPKKAGPEIIRIYRRNPTVDTGAHFLIKQLIWKARGTHFKFIFFVISSSKPQTLYLYLPRCSLNGWACLLRQRRTEAHRRHRRHWSLSTCFNIAYKSKSLPCWSSLTQRVDRNIAASLVFLFFTVILSLAANARW